MQIADVGDMRLDNMNEWKCSVFSLMQLRDAVEGRVSFRSKVNGSVPSVLKTTAHLGVCLHREIKSFRVEVATIFISMAAEQLAELVRAFTCIPSFLSVSDISPREFLGLVRILGLCDLMIPLLNCGAPTQNALRLAGLEI